MIIKRVLGPSDSKKVSYAASPPPITGHLQNPHKSFLKSTKKASSNMISKSVLSKQLSDLKRGDGQLSMNADLAYCCKWVYQSPLKKAQRSGQGPEQLTRGYVKKVKITEQKKDVKNENETEDLAIRDTEPNIADDSVQIETDSVDVGQLDS